MKNLFTENRLIQFSPEQPKYNPSVSNPEGIKKTVKEGDKMNNQVKTKIAKAKKTAKNLGKINPKKAQDLQNLLNKIDLKNKNPKLKKQQITKVTENNINQIIANDSDLQETFKSLKGVNLEVDSKTIMANLNKTNAGSGNETDASKIEIADAGKDVNIVPDTKINIPKNINISTPKIDVNLNASNKPQKNESNA